MAHDVFISYAGGDKPIADAACATLENSGVRCWMAPRDILSGLDWSAAIVDAISSSSLLVLIFSAGSNQSPQVKREVERAVSRGIPVVPFRIEAVPLSKHMEFFISTPHWLDALTPPLEAHLQRLTTTVKLLLENVRGEPLPDATAVRSAASAPVVTEAPHKGVPYEVSPEWERWESEIVRRIGPLIRATPQNERLDERRNPWAIVGAFIIGLFTELSTLWLPAEFKFVGALLVLIIVLLIRPQGLLGKAQRVG